MIYVGFWLTKDPGTLAMRLLQLAMVCGYALAVLFFWSRPWLMVLGIAAFTAAGWLLELTREPFVVASWALYCAGRLMRGLRYVVPTALAVASMLLFCLLSVRAPAGEALTLQVVMSAVLLFGSWLLGVQGKAEAEEKARAEIARERTRVLEDRAKVARDLHDILSHTLSGIGIRAAVAAELDESGDEEVLRTFHDIEDASRDALEEVRSVLGGVRAGEADRYVVTTEDIGALVDRSRANGFKVDAVMDFGSLAGAPIAYDLYLVVQELVTNIGRHASGSAGELEIDVRRPELRVRARNHFDRMTRDSAHGMGLSGIKERISALGGRSEIMERDGVFNIEIVVPVRTAIGSKVDDSG
ncbi:sensor histidine kinase [Actinomyces glycerinitolerans]|nr:histidine kinase [Actinomyces glycerinitolerans]